MHRVPWTLSLLALVACEPGDPSELFEIRLSGGEPSVRLDLDPLTLSDVDNNIDVDIEFLEEGATTAATSGGTGTGDDSSDEATLYQYKIEYYLSDTDRADPIAGSLNEVKIAPGETVTLSLRGVADSQLDWAAVHYRGAELSVLGLVTIDGTLGSEKLLPTFEFTAIFADYE